MSSLLHESDSMHQTENAPLLEIRNLSVEFHSMNGIVKAVDDVSITVRKGESLGIVGESGCGKSATALSILRLLGPSGLISHGQILFKAKDLLDLKEGELLKIRGKEISIIFQEPRAALNPV